MAGATRRGPAAVVRPLTDQVEEVTDRGGHHPWALQADERLQVGWSGLIVVRKSASSDRTFSSRRTCQLVMACWSARCVRQRLGRSPRFPCRGRWAVCPPQPPDRAPRPGLGDQRRRGAGSARPRSAGAPDPAAVNPAPAPAPGGRELVVPGGTQREEQSPARRPGASWLRPSSVMLTILLLLQHRKAGPKVMTGRVADVSFVLDELTAPRSIWPHAGLIDASSIAMAGHSAGGASAIPAMLADARICASTDIEGSTEDRWRCPPRRWSREAQEPDNVVRRCCGSDARSQP